MAELRRRRTAVRSSDPSETWSFRKKKFAFGSLSLPTSPACSNASSSEAEVDEVEVSKRSFSKYMMRFDDDLLEESFIVETFRNNYDVQVTVLTMAFFMFLLARLTQASSMAQALSLLAFFVPLLGVTLYTRRRIHLMDDHSRARRLGKNLTLISAYMVFFVKAASIALGGAAANGTSVFIGTLRFIEVGLFALWMHTWTLTLGERLMLYAWIVGCNAAEPSFGGMSELEDLLVLLTVLAVGFFTSCALERSREAAGPQTLRSLSSVALSRALSDGRHTCESRSCERARRARAAARPRGACADGAPRRLAAQPRHQE